MSGLRSWLLSVLTVSLFCAVAQAVMPGGAVGRVGKLVCGLSLLCAVLWPAARLDPGLGEGWLRAWRQSVKEDSQMLEEQAADGARKVIEERCAAYIVDKAAEHGVLCTARVLCRAVEGGLYVPDSAQVRGALSGAEVERLKKLVSHDLGIPAERQTYHREACRE